MTNVISTIINLPAYLSTIAMVKSGKIERALISAEKLLRNNPLNSKFIVVFTQAAVSANLPETAIQTLEIARDHYPNDVATLNWLGVLYQKVGRTRSARECFEKLCEICPSDPTALKSLKDAMALDSMSTDGWTESAETGGTYRELIKDAKEAELLEQEAKAMKNEKDVDALIINIQTKLASEPGNMNYYRFLAKLYTQKKMFGDAIATLKKAMEIGSSDPELDNAMISIRVQQLDDEISQLKAIGNIDGSEAKEAEKKQFIFKNLQEMVRRYPNDLKLRYEWGVILYDNSSLNDAIQQFQMSQRNPKYQVKSLYYLAMCFKQKKQYDLALNQLEKAASETPIINETKKDILYELGEISGLTGNKDKAAGYYKQIYQADISYRDIAEKIEQVYKTREKL